MTTPSATAGTGNNLVPTATREGMRTKLGGDQEAQITKHLEHYRYEVLPNTTSVRLATIHPGKFGDMLELSLHIATFTPGSPPLYEALSYVWGSEKDPQVLVVGSSTNRGVLRVTQNLVGALRYLRKEDKPRIVWIDAVCINQADSSEKGPQVAMMGEIYRLASRVVVWLGPAADDSDLAMDLIDGMGRQVEVDFNHYTMMPSEDASDCYMGDRTSGLPYEKRHLCSLYHLMSRPWFGRLWVRQEIYLANSAIIQCGLCWVPWFIFRKAWYCLYAKPWPAFDFSQECSELMGNLYGFLHQPQRISLLDLREMFSIAKCKDGRDRIYGLLQLLDEKERDVLNIRPDYTKPVMDVFRDVTLAYLTHYASAGILVQCQLRPEEPRPSWVPNWQSSDQSELFLLSASRASGPLASHWSQPRPGVLRMAGVSIATVEHLLDHGVASSSPNGHLAAEIYHLMRQAQIRSKDGAEGASFITAFTRTLLLDRFSDIYAPSGSFPSMLDSLHFVEQLASTEGDESKINQVAANAKHRALLNRCRFYILGNKPLVTDDGSIALAPACAERGDRICVLLGCDRPMLLRPEAEGGYLVVGACFLSRVQFGEAILGHLPANIRPQSRWNKQEAGWENGFCYSTSGDFTPEDPRLERFGVDLADYRKRLQKTPWTTLKIHPNILRKAGVKIEDFDLF